MKNKNENARKVLSMLRNAGGNVSALGLFRLIRKTNGITVPTLVVLHNYTSDKSDNTELADYTLNLGTKYENAKEKTGKQLSDIDKPEMVELAALCTTDQIKGFRYIDRKGLTELAYCIAVKAMLPTALDEMKNVTARPNENVIQLNSVLSFNANTGNLLMVGELIKGGKDTTVKGEVKMTAKAAKTVAKEVIKGYLNARTSKIRSFNVANLNYISVGGEKIALNVG